MRTPCAFQLFTVYRKPIKSRALSGCPIVSGNGNLTKKNSKLVDAVPSPNVLTLSSYIQDTGNFLKNIENLNVPPTSLLVTIDVESLYSSIPITKGFLL